MTDLLRALSGNGSVNTFQHATMGVVFSVDECYSSLLGSTTILATVGEGSFSVWSAPRNSRTVFSVLSVPSLYNASPLVVRGDNLGRAKSGDETGEIELIS
jgi:hypothetical protein